MCNMSSLNNSLRGVPSGLSILWYTSTKALLFFFFRKSLIWLLATSILGIRCWRLGLGFIDTYTIDVLGSLLRMMLNRVIKRLVTESPLMVVSRVARSLSPQ